jgi:undecaprenyl-diphosphatase
LLLAVAAVAGVGATVRRRYDVAVVAAVALVGVLVDGVASHAVPVHGDASSFPSGHATASMAVAAAVVFVSWSTTRRALVCIAAPAFAALAGVSRLYFGVHHVTDVIAGWATGLAVTAVVAALVLRTPYRRWSTAAMAALGIATALALVCWT